MTAVQLLSWFELRRCSQWYCKTFPMKPQQARPISLPFHLSRNIRVTCNQWGPINGVRVIDPTLQQHQSLNWVPDSRLALHIESIITFHQNQTTLTQLIQINTYSSMVNELPQSPHIWIVFCRSLLSSSADISFCTPIPHA